MPETITGRVVATRRISTSALGNPRYAVTINTSPDRTGFFGAIRTTDRYAPNAQHCYECRRTFTDNTPAGRCPWEDTHDDTTNVRTSIDSGLAYGIENPEYRDDYHTFTISRGNITAVNPA